MCDDKNSTKLKMLESKGRVLFYILLVVGSFCFIPYRLLDSKAFKDFLGSNEQVVETLKLGPVKKVGFLKTHKCASTSIQNILFRYGLNNNLNFVMDGWSNHLGDPTRTPYNRQMISKTPWEKAGLNYSIFAIHTIWNYKEISKTLNDQGDVSYISIIRDPVDLFVSFWDFELSGGSINKFVMSLPLGRPHGKLGLNQMLRDFGVKLTDMFNRDVVLAKIKEIEKTFDLIMVVERLEDSIILMKNELRWTYEDVVNFKLNEKDPSKKSTLTDEARMHLKQYLWPDYLLYNHFIKIFEEKYQQLDPDIVASQKAILNNVANRVKNDCILEKINSQKVHNKLYGVNMMVFINKEGSNATCKYYTMKEVWFLKYLRKVQRERANNILKMRQATDK